MDSSLNSRDLSSGLSTNPPEGKKDEKLDDLIDWFEERP